MLWFAVAARVISNPLANVFQKLLTNRGAHPLFIIFASHALLSGACLPVLLSRSFILPNAFWFNIWFCAVLAVAGNALLVEALKRCDLSVLGPINAYKAVVSLLPAIILLREIPGLSALLGIALIVAGSYWVAEERSTNAFTGFLKAPGVQLRLAALVLSAVEAVFLKRAILVSSALITFLFWSVLGLLVSLAWLMLTRFPFRAEVERLSVNKSAYLLLGLTTGVMQLCTLLVMEHLYVSSALALFQTSALLSVFFGHAIFKERRLARRVVGTTIMICGACLIILRRP